MATFVDLKNRTWNIVVTVGTVKRVRDLLGVDLLGIVSDAKALEGLINDPETLVNLVYACLKPDLDAVGVSDLEFGESMAGDVLDAATSAFLDALTNFFPKAKRGVLQAAFRKLEQLQAIATTEAMAQIESPDLEKNFRALLGKQYSHAPASPELNQTG